MRADKIEIACFSDEGSRFAEVFEGEDAMERAVGFFLAAMSQDTWNKVRKQMAEAALDAHPVGKMFKPGTRLPL